ncbi:MAG: HlyC/CorC family transporter [Ardenticatenaceae bacterium]|nr:HlyC/CorC family transporter [Anaerolineales bacterium]MCB8941108.1 HlyC/CorC family transporter [Ardenticatenaceae bacterium]MCB8972449.1 HlyC/CorC family transporter [Ardenticatenaceae bacterium]
MFLTILSITAVVAIMILFNALYVAAEFATVSSRRTRVSQMAGQGNRMAQLLLPIMQDSKKLDRYVATCQIGITISSLVVGAYGQSVIAQLLVQPFANLLTALEPFLASIGIESTAGWAEPAATSIAVTLVLVFITILQVIMGELFPKSVAIQYPETVALAVTIPMRITQFFITYTGLIALFNGSGNLILRLLGRPMKEKSGHAHSPEEIELLVTESHEQDLLSDEERRLLRNTFRLRDLTARQVMLHRTKLITAPSSSSVTELMQIALEAGFSRIPLYKESVDDICGFVHVKDLFRLHHQQSEDISSILREVVFVPETMPVTDLWKRLNSRRKYLAIVFDEYGGTVGLITFEDIIEEIFGELQDEFDNETALIAKDKDGRIYLRADLLVTDVNEYLELNLPEENADTLGGLVFSELGRPPEVGDTVAFGNITIRVEAMADPSVSEVSLQLPVTESAEEPFIEWEVADHD